MLVSKHDNITINKSELGAHSAGLNLQRIYGTSFPSLSSFSNWEKKTEIAKTNDHRGCVNKEIKPNN